MRVVTAGESHGKALIAVIEGLPAGLRIDAEEINSYLLLRQSGYGRGARQKIERDCAEIVSGVRDEKTLASPLTLVVRNRDYENWWAYMSPEKCDTTARVLTRVRPGHADLAGMMKYGTDDARNILERASARETAVRVAAGTVMRQYLRALGVEVSGYVVSVCGIRDEKRHDFSELERAKDEPLFMLDGEKQREAMSLLDRLKTEGDTAGGVIEIRVKGLKSGFGSCMQYSTKLDALLAAEVMSVQAIKGVEIGLGFACAELRGSRVHDPIGWDGEKFTRVTNNAGGIEGGMSNGEEIVIRAAMKPIPTLMRGLDTVDYVTKAHERAASERSDVAAVCAAEIVAESAVCTALANAVSDRLGGDYMEQVVARYKALK